MDDNGNLIVYATDLSASQNIRDAVRSEIKITGNARQPALSASMVVKEAAYSFTELREWRDLSSAKLLSLANITLVDLDEKRNRLVVGVSEPGGSALASEILLDMGIPAEAVLFETTGHIYVSETLSDSVRPVVGGLMIGPSGCSFGFNAEWEGQDVWFTASHCSQQQFSTDQGNFYQSGEFLGNEQWDRSSYECPSWFPYGAGQCRASDATMIERVSGTTYGFGEIARTMCCGTYGLGGSGSKDIDPNNPIFPITGEVDYPTVGQYVDKMGRMTGWTFGEVLRTCVDIDPDGTSVDLFCQDTAAYGNQGGDSGAPVFIWHGSTIELTGIHWGISETGESVFSPLGNVKYDYEYAGPWHLYNLDTF